MTTRATPALRGLPPGIEFTRWTTPGTALLLALAVIAFWPAYLRDPIGLGRFYMHLHAVTGTLWFALVLVQPILLRLGRRDAHRRLGQVSWVLGPVVILAMVFASHAFQEVMMENGGRPGPHVFWLQAWLAVLFALFWAGAMLRRRDRIVHPRLMVATVFTFVDPVIARIAGMQFGLPGQLVSFACLDLALLALIVLEWRTPRARRLWLLVGAIFLAFEIPLLLGAAGSDLWLGVTRAWLALPLTP